MRGVMAFLVWLFGLWTRFRNFVMVSWMKLRPLDQGRVDSNVGMEQLRCNEGEHKSALATFLSSVLNDSDYLSYSCMNEGFRLYGYVNGCKQEFLVDEATHGEVMATIASSNLKGCRSFSLRSHSKSYYLKQYEEIVGALVSNNNIQEVGLDFGRCSALQVAQCVSKLLSGNRVIEYLKVELRNSREVVGREAAELLANVLRENQSLKRLTLYWYVKLVDDEAMEVLTKPLKDNDSVLDSLDFNQITNVGLEHLGVMLATNTPLKTLDYSLHEKVESTNKGDDMYINGCTSLSQALCINKSLEDLTCAVGSRMELKVLLEPLMPLNNNPQANTTLTSLSLWGSTIGGQEGVEVLTNMICTNTSLLKLDLGMVKELQSTTPDGAENVVAIMEALKTNKSLKTMGLYGCKGVGGYKVLGTMMDMLLENHHLEEINLYDTPLDSSRDAKYVHYELEKKKKMKVWELIKSMANVSPKSGRVFLCGNPRAGKTTLRMSIKGLPEFQNPHASRLSVTKRMRRRFGTSKVPKVLKPKPEIDRTRGIEVDHVESDGIGISIWDMAGQTDYHSFHDLVIPNLSADGSCSLFLLTCNPMHESPLEMRNIFEIKIEVEYWLRFIASNTRRSWQYRPHVSIVMTHHDLWHDEVDFQSRIEDVVADLKLQFEEVLEFDPKKEFFMVNGGEESCASTLFDFMKGHLKQLLARLPKTIKACSEVQRLIFEWNQELLKEVHGGQTSKVRMLKWDEFSERICKGVEELQDGDKELARRKQEFVAVSLNDGGHIMYHEVGKFVIMDPHWFCHDIMGEFLHQCANMDAKLEMVSAHGIISSEHVKRILVKIMGGQGQEDLLDATLSMMKKLQMCYEQDDKNIMIPSTLRDKREFLSWLTMPQSEKFMYVGRRLSCKDAKRTMLSLGFFPRLQVSFFQKFKNNNVGNSYQLFEDVIMFVDDGIEVIIEFDHVDVDIMLRSKVCQDEMLEFLGNGIVRHIQDMLMNPTLGCPGVILVEYILRPKCVEELVKMRDRKDQFVYVEELELEVVTCGFGATHNWKQCGHLKRGYDKVRDLLGTKAWAKLLKKWYNDLERYQEQIFQMSSKDHERDTVIGEKRTESGWRSTIWETLQNPINFVRDCPNPLMKGVNVKLDNIDQKLDMVIRKVDDILQMQETILRMQNNLLREVSSRIEDLMEFSFNIHRSQVPKIPYLSEVGQKKLLTRIVPGLEEFDLHLMCESKDGIHVVEGQEGCKVNFGTRKTRTIMAMVDCGLKLLTILTKIGAHVAGGMGEMVPDLSNGVLFVGLLLDTPNLLDQMSSLLLNSVPVIERGSSTITKKDRLEVEKWLIEVLEPKCKEESTFYRMFGLRKVVYRGVGSGKVSIAWLCDHCEENGMKSGELYNAM